MKRILVLDDSSSILSFLQRELGRWGYEVLLAQTVQEAEAALAESPDFAIIDVFLLGGEGEHLSAAFIQTHIEPRGIPYGRFTSAPESVPAQQEGAWVLHKYDVKVSPDLLKDALIEVFNQES